MSEPSEKGFRVQDRRRFDAEGNIRPADSESGGDAEERPAPGEPKREAAAPAPPVEEPRPSEGPGPAPEDLGSSGPVGFSELVLSIATNALVFLGRENPGDTGSVSASKVDLRLASQNIDILAMLEEKTRGNLTSHESELLGSILYDLRTLYVETAKTVRS